MQAKIIGIERRSDRAGEPVEADVGEHLVAGEGALDIAAAIGPGAEFLDDPGGEPGGRIGQAEAQRLRARALNRLIAGLLLEPMIELIEKDPLLGRRVLHHVRVAAHGEQIDMNADQLVGMRVAHPRGGDGAPVAALHGEALVAERLGHQFGETIRHLLDAEALLPGPERKAIARQRRRDDGEGIRRIAAEARRIGEARNEVDELEHRARPAVHQKERHRIGPFPGTCRKCRSLSGRVSLNCGKALSRASCARQSKDPRQYSTRLRR